MTANYENEIVTLRSGACLVAAIAKIALAVASFYLSHVAQASQKTHSISVARHLHLKLPRWGTYRRGLFSG
jgi:hypothetical protein